MGRLYNYDVIEMLRKMPSNSIDLIITSPPYNLGNAHHTGTYRHKAYDDNMNENDYQQWQIDVLNECYRVLKDDGSMFYNHKNRIKKGVQITPYEWLLKTDFIVKQELVWFNGSQNFDKIRFYPMTERVYWLAKSSNTKLFNTINHHDFFDKKDWTPVGTKGTHKRAFPLQMPLDIINCFENAKVVLDPFMGSGTVGVACKLLNRDFYGIEISKEYFELAKQRIANYESERE